MPGQPRDGQSRSRSVSAVILGEARGPSDLKRQRHGGMTGSLSGAAVPPDSSSVIQIQPWCECDGRRIEAPMEVGRRPGPENKSILYESSIISRRVDARRDGNQNELRQTKTRLSESSIVARPGRRSRRDRRQAAGGSESVTNEVSPRRRVECHRRCGTGGLFSEQ
jgi:hypothetical protein